MIALRVAIGLLLLPACSGAFGPPIPNDGLPDAAPADGAVEIDNPVRTPVDRTGEDAGADDFIIDDPLPPICTPDGMMSQPTPVEGTADCPADKNRSGCSCPRVGMRASCWPGKRLNRGHGICKDGMTTCYDNAEFGPAWGPCEGYVLPVDGAERGPDACRCFASGAWALDNLVPCVDAAGPTLYSSRPDATSGFACDPLVEMRSTVWTSSRLKVDCAGQFELCYTLKAGRADDPQPTDCTLMRSCVDVWYERAGEAQPLPDLPGWVSADRACAARFIDIGGYGEMSVRGRSVECEPVDDGEGGAYVFARTAYCGPECANSDSEECQRCSASGGGDF